MTLDHPIFTRWPAQCPDRLQLFSAPTPNGVKVGIVVGADYGIADISLLGWVRNLIGFYEAREPVGFDRFLHVQAWLDRGLARPAVQRGLEVTAG